MACIISYSSRSIATYLRTYNCYDRIVHARGIASSLWNNFHSSRTDSQKYIRPAIDEWLPPIKGPSANYFSLPFHSIVVVKTSSKINKSSPMFRDNLTSFRDKHDGWSSCRDRNFNDRFSNLKATFSSRKSHYLYHNFLIFNFITCLHKSRIKMMIDIGFSSNLIEKYYVTYLEFSGCKMYI